MSQNIFDYVIIGRGVQGTSFAAHALARKPDTKILVIERGGKEAVGSSRYALGGVSGTQFDASQLLGFNLRSRKEFDNFESKYGVDIGWPRVEERPGNLALAVTQEGADKARQQAIIQDSLGIKTLILLPDEIKAKWPNLNLEDVKAAMYCPEDGYVDPSAMITGYSKYADIRGAKFAFNTEVLGIRTNKQSEVEAVITDQGTVLTRNVVDAAGTNDRLIASWLLINLPTKVEAREIFDATLNIQWWKGRMPLITFIDGPFGHYYVRLDSPGAVRVGIGRTEFYGDKGKIDDPGRKYKAEYQNEAEAFLKHVFPEGMSIEDMNGVRAIRSTTIRGTPFIGPVDQVPGFNLLCGFGSRGIMYAPASGDGLAELLIEGKLNIETSACSFKGAEGLRGEIHRQTELKA